MLFFFTFFLPFLNSFFAMCLIVVVVVVAAAIVVFFTCPLPFTGCMQGAGVGTRPFLSLFVMI